MVDWIKYERLENVWGNHVSRVLKEGLVGMKCTSLTEDLTNEYSLCGLDLCERLLHVSSLIAMGSSVPSICGWIWPRGWRYGPAAGSESQGWEDWELATDKPFWGSKWRWQQVTSRHTFFMDFFILLCLVLLESTLEPHTPWAITSIEPYPSPTAPFCPQQALHPEPATVELPSWFPMLPAGQNVTCHPLLLLTVVSDTV